jgi:ubiquinone/menaquinone biosynthesis C-methylase UbiE
VPRSREDLRAQFEFERQQRTRLLQSTREERPAMTSQIYDELFERFPEHSALTETAAGRAEFGRRRAGLILPLARPGQKVLEVGCGRGDALVALAAGGLVCYGLEPSRRMLGLAPKVPGVSISYGTAERLEIADASFDLVFSQQVLEHLHPDEVPVHFREAWRVLRRGGVLAVETPNRRTGPQDVSRGFTPTAEGLHLKEWSVRELADEIGRAGFVGVQGLLAPPVLARRSAALHRLFRAPAAVKVLQDHLLALVPGLSLRTLAGKILGLDDIFLFAHKE